VTHELLDAEYRRALDLLRRHLAPGVAAGAAGDHRTRHRGAGQEFHDHRPYVAGDDLRRVDWMAYARTGEPVTRNLRAEEDVLLRVLIDTSASMGDEKLAHAARIAAGLGYLGLLGGERVQVIPFAAAPDGRRRAERGRAALPSLLRALDPLVAAGVADLPRALDLALAPGAPAVVVVLSDLLDAGDAAPFARAADPRRHDLRVVHVLARTDVDPPLDGDLDLEDAETVERLAVTVDAALLDRYRARFAAWCHDLDAAARARGARLVRSVSDEPAIDAVRALLRADRGS
jgi:uncharacterized protein (DUF58 family)